MHTTSHFSRAALLAAIALVSSAQAMQAQSATTAFVDVTVVPLDRERVVEHQTVIVSGDRITAIGPVAATAVPQGATRIDGRGKFLMPGLAEMHAHVVGGNNPNHESVNRDILFLYVANGITSIRAMLGAPNQIPLRDQLSRGEVLGPTMYVSAPSLNGNSAPNPDSAASLVRAHKAAGYDFLKIHPGLSRPTYDAIARTAKELGITWAGHVPADVGLMHALASGQATVDHLDGFLEASVPDSIGVRVQNQSASFEELVSSVDPGRFPDVARRMKDANVWSVPTMVIWENLYTQSITPEEMARREELRYWPRQAVANFVRQKNSQVEAQRRNDVTAPLASRYLELRRQALRTLADAGAPLLMGTDSPQLFSVPGFSLHREMAALAEIGLTPFQIYQSGSKNVADYVAQSLELDGRFGTVTVGNRADLVLLDANPLESVANLTRRSGVMVKGRWMSAAEIERGLADLAERYAR